MCVETTSLALGSLSALGCLSTVGYSSYIAVMKSLTWSSDFSIDWYSNFNFSINFFIITTNYNFDGCSATLLIFQFIFKMLGKSSSAGDIDIYHLQKMDNIYFFIFLTL